MDDVSKNLEKFINSTLDNALLKGLEYVGQAIENDAKDECPVDDGQLKASMTHEVKSSEAEVIIGTCTEYAPMVAFGTGIYAVEGNGRKEVPWRYQDAKGIWHTTEGQKPNNFLQRAVDMNRDTILKKLGEGAQIEWKK